MMKRLDVTHKAEMGRAPDGLAYGTRNTQHRLVFVSFSGVDAERQWTND